MTLSSSFNVAITLHSGFGNDMKKELYKKEWAGNKEAEISIIAFSN